MQIGDEFAAFPDKGADVVWDVDAAVVVYRNKIGLRTELVPAELGEAGEDKADKIYTRAFPVGPIAAARSARMRGSAASGAVQALVLVPLVAAATLAVAAAAAAAFAFALAFAT